MKRTNWASLCTLFLGILLTIFGFVFSMGLDGPHDSPLVRGLAHLTYYIGLLVAVGGFIWFVVSEYKRGRG